jgi:Tol biopolymer transport system component
MFDDLKESPSPRGVRLDGWKDIAKYLGSPDPRTVQRWEKKRGLRVFREGDKVFAYAADLDQWRAGRVVAPAGSFQPVSAAMAEPTTTALAPPIERPTSVIRWKGLVAAAALLCCVLAWHFWPRELQLLSCRQLTRDGRRKYGVLFADRLRIYFTEVVGGRPVIASVPIAGGDASFLQLPFDPIELLGGSLNRDSLLMLGKDRRLFEWQITSRKAREIPVPAGLLGSAVWDPSGRRIALSGNDSLAVIEPWTPANSRPLQYPGQVFVSGWDPQSGRLRFEVLDTKAGTSQWHDWTDGDPAPHPMAHLSPNPTERNGAWTGDGRFFIFEAESAGHSELWVADGDARGQSRSYPLTIDARAWRNPRALPDANTMLAFAGESQGRLVRLPPAHAVAELKPVLPGVPAYELDYSRDQTLVAYTRFPDHSIWRCQPDGSAPRLLTPPQMIAHQPHWSPDGTRIAFMGKKAEKNSHWRIYVVPSPGGDLYEPLPQGEDQGVPTWSPDGRYLYFGDLRAMAGFNRASIHELDLETRTLSTVAGPLGLWSPRMSPDGKHLAAVSHDNKSLYVRDNTRRTWRKCASMDILEEVAWPPDSAWIQFASTRQNGARALFRVSPNCEQPRQVVDLSDYALLGDAWFGIAPDRSPMVLLRIPEEIYALDWNLRRQLP